MTIQKLSLKALLTLPNLLSCFRFVSSPVLLWLAWHGYQETFLILLAVTLLTDMLDGFFARMLNQQSELGALLDSQGDLVIYTTIAASVWWLWPDIVQRELSYVVIAIISYLLPVIVGFIKFGALTSYHTWLVKFAAISMGLAFFLLFVFDISEPFRIAVFICLLAAIEEIIITFYLSELRSNIRSLWHAIKKMS
ncbi:MAG: CDP-alcohol phosphatidyltransferase family protein [Gammaproteobacteria bacterium]|nr:CDP-alcohol phosphatidyltransferase family protein [Gammaproteobacteria bacterium]MDH5591701.1 CDP-alcohol phosphatidyltransferase family protein [Gammaproteobacteria bacterium]